MITPTLGGSYQLAAILFGISVVGFTIFRSRLIMALSAVLYLVAGMTVLMTDLVIVTKPEKFGPLDYLATAIVVILLILGGAYLDFRMNRLMNRPYHLNEKEANDA